MQIENVETPAIFIQIRRDEHAVQLAVKGKINGEISYFSVIGSTKTRNYVVSEKYSLPH